MALGCQSPRQLSLAAERECKDGSTFLEFRLDLLDHPRSGLAVIRDMRVRYPETAILATCRHEEHGGGFRGRVAEQFAILREAAQAGAAMLDLEIETAECDPAATAALRTIPLLISFHDFAGTPALASVLRRLERIPADAYKIATTAAKPGDVTRLMTMAREKRDVPLVSVAMSDIGNPVRILGPSWGSVFTYAAPAGGQGTAAGQIPARLMRTVYRSEKLTKKTRVYGVVADPVAHSKSPLMHNRAFQIRRLDAVYVPFRVLPGQLSDFMKLSEALPVAGFSVTIPHKRKIMRYLDIVDPLAKRIGAVNTVWRKGGKWRGANTDTQGVLKPLATHLRLAHSSVLIAGYGGAARAAAIAVADAGASVTITGRSLESAAALARVIKAQAMSLRDAEAGTFDALIHATPVGMTPQPDACLFGGRIPANVVLDMVYNPPETELLRRAKEQGSTVISGLEMLLEQACYQFEIWTGESAPRAAMLAALDTETDPAPRLAN